MFGTSPLKVAEGAPEGEVETETFLASVRIRGVSVETTASYWVPETLPLAPQLAVSPLASTALKVEATLTGALAKVAVESVAEAEEPTVLKAWTARAAKAFGA